MYVSKSVTGWSHEELGNGLSFLTLFPVLKCKGWVAGISIRMLFNKGRTIPSHLLSRPDHLGCSNRTGFILWGSAQIKAYSTPSVNCKRLLLTESSPYSKKLTPLTFPLANPYFFINVYVFPLRKEIWCWHSGWERSQMNPLNRPV